MIRQSLLLATCALALLPSTANADHLPRPKGHVNDFAGVLDDADERRLETSLREYEAGTGRQIAVALVKDLDEGDIDDFTVRAFEEWGVGTKNEDDGVLLLAAIDDRKVRIEVGYGVEGELTDGEAGNIVRNIIPPAFQRGDYAEGINAAVDAIETELGGESSPAANAPSERPSEAPPGKWTP